MNKISIIALASILSLSACVTKSRLNKSQSKVQILQQDSTKTHGLLDDCNLKLSASKNNASELQQEKESVEKDLQNLSSESQANINSKQLTIAEQEKRLKDLQTLIKSQKDVMNKLKKVVADALVNFKPDELTVAIKDGKIYVSLQEKLLFKSGSDAVDPKGKEALQSVATVLNSNPDISVLIEGHTDSIPIKGKFQDNWALSVSRATSIVRILTNDYKVNAQRVTASGRGEYYPILNNSTAENRSRNRRTEIILSPNLNELFKLLEQ